MTVSVLVTMMVTATLSHFSAIVGGFGRFTVREVINGDLRLILDYGLSQSEAETPMRDNGSAKLLNETLSTTKVVGVRMGDQYGMNVLRQQLRLPQPMLYRLPGDRTRQPGIDEGSAILVQQGIHVHVAEPR
jgi:hypothetical protein